MTDTASRLLKARLRVILTSPFFGSLLMRLPLIPDPSVKTFSTNGREIRYCPAYADQLSDLELRGVLVHEVCHCAQGHLWRMGEREPHRWNVAADYAVNGLLSTYAKELSQPDSSGRPAGAVPWELPASALQDSSLAELSTEEIYHRLPEPPPSSGENSSNSGESPANGKGAEEAASCGEFTAPAEDGDGLPLEADWQIAVTQAATAAKIAGSLPGSLQRLVSELLEPRVSWREVLREFIRQFARDDYSFARPNRRYLANRVVLPSLHSERMGRLVIAVDTSGSIGQHELAGFQAEIQAALDECRPEAIEVIYCDTKIQGVEEFTPGDTVRLEALGGGGTRFTPVFDRVATAAEPPVALIYLTDGHGSFPSKEPDYPVLWASTESSQYPFGEVVALHQ